MDFYLLVILVFLIYIMYKVSQTQIIQYKTVLIPERTYEYINVPFNYHYQPFRRFQEHKRQRHLKK